MNKLLYWLSLLLLALFIFFPTKENFDVDSFSTDKITVEVKGEVSEPGIYHLKAYSTVSDLLKMVQLNDEADTSSLNLTLVLKDNDVIVIDKKSQEEKISINTASLEELCTIPYVGEKTAQKIIDYRQQNGPFQTLEELMNIKGIGEKKFAKMQEYIRL